MTDENFISELEDSFPNLLIRSDFKDSLGIHLENFFMKLESKEKLNVEGTRVIARAYYFKPKSKLDQFINKVFYKIIDYSIPREDIDEISKVHPSKYPAEYAALQEKARRKFVDFHRNRKSLEKEGKLKRSTTGEFGELLLFMLAEEVLKYPQLLSKMSLKTSGMMHYHGVDGVHISSENGKLLLHYGESKMFKNRTTAVKNCLNDISKHLDLDDEDELNLISSNLNLGGELKKLEPSLKKFFDYEKHKYQDHVEVCGMCLVGFDSDVYEGDVLNNIELEISEWIKEFRDRVKTKKLEEVSINIFFMPCRSVQDIRNKFSRKLGS